MRRRNLLIGFGALLTSGGAILGSGGFSAVHAERSATIDVANDADAFLGLERHPDRPDAVVDDPYFDENEGRLAFYFDGADEAVDGETAAEGLNDEAVTYFDDLLLITNNGTNTVVPEIELIDTDGNVVTGTGFRPYRISGDDRPDIDYLALDPEAGINVGFEFDLLEGDASAYDAVDAIRIEATEA